LEEEPLGSAHKDKLMVQKILECYNVTKEEYEDKNPRNVQVPKTKGTHTIEGP
jgi:hypothetical protein